MPGTLCDLLYSLAVNMTGWKKIEMSSEKKQHPSRPNYRVSCLLLGPLLTQTVLFHMRVGVKTLFDGSGAACLFPPSDMVSWAFNYKHNVAPCPCSFTLARGHCRLLQHRQGYGLPVLTLPKVHFGLIQPCLSWTVGHHCFMYIYPFLYHQGN